MICVGTRPFVRIGWVQKGIKMGSWDDRGMMSSQVGAGCRPGTCGGKNGVAFGLRCRKRRME